MIIEGIIQGLTEFLPISSSGHLALIQSILGEGSIQSVVLLHLGTLLAVIIFFRGDIIRIIKGLTKGMRDPNTQFVLYLIVGTLPAVIIGFSIQGIIDMVFKSPRIIFGLLIINGLFILGTRFKPKGGRVVKVLDALIIGIYQALAILPGISRSGATIGIGIYLGIKPMEAFRFSFLLSIPAILGASVLELKGVTETLSAAWPGFLASFLFGLLALTILRRLVFKRLFYLFGIYCIAIGMIGSIFF